MENIATVNIILLVLIVIIGFVKFTNNSIRASDQDQKNEDIKHDARMDFLNKKVYLDNDSLTDEENVLRRAAYLNAAAERGVEDGYNRNSSDRMAALMRISIRDLGYDTEAIEVYEKSVQIGRENMRADDLNMKNRTKQNIRIVIE